jgi:hypothetical protein
MFIAKITYSKEICRKFVWFRIRNVELQLLTLYEPVNLVCLIYLKSILA